MIDNSLEQKLMNLPEVIAGKGIWQNKFHEFDIYDHTMSYVSYLREMTLDPEMITASYLHDIGKPVVKKVKMKNGKIEEKEDGKPYHDFDEHEIIGERMVRAMPKGLFAKYNLNQEKIAKLVGAHFLPMSKIKEMRTTPNYDLFVKKYNELEQELDSTGLERKEVMTMFLADCLSKGKTCTDIEELKLAREVIMSRGNLRLLDQLYNLQKQFYGGKE